ncbi:MAG: 16S rRNA (cytidine(1402)-2'-O)-methyltransferase [Pyrinomonadaceae bacterium]
MFGTLYLVATPIGNLSDISERALKTLREADLIACEDTRHTRKLLTHFGISNKLKSYHEHNETARAEEFIQLLTDGKNIAVVSDAGTPGISDPSFRIVQKARETGVKVVSIPGAVAFVTAAIVSGLPTDSLFFGGFLPSKKGERQKRLEEVRKIPATLVFYESPRRLEKSLADCAEILGNRKASVARELTKLHEEVLGGNLDELAKNFAGREVKGEIVLVIDREEIQSPKSKLQTPKSVLERIVELEEKGLDRKAALKKTAKEFGISRSEAYRLLVSAKKD